MGDCFYKVVRFIGSHPFWASGRPLVVGVEQTQREGAFIVAATHQSAYDVPLMIRHSRRALDFVSITEVFRNPLVAWFYGSMNAFPLDRSRRDPATVRVILDRLKRGRAVAMFPEGRFARGEASVLHLRKIKPGIGRLAHMAGVPVIPCVIRDSLQYAKPMNWLPIRRTRYAIAFGPPLQPDADHSRFEMHFVEALLALDSQLGERGYPTKTATGNPSNSSAA